MAIDTRQRVDAALAILRKGLSPYVRRELKMRYKARWWTDGVEPSLGGSRDRERINAQRLHTTEEEWLQLLDTQKLLTVVLDQWHEVFRDRLHSIVRIHARELREIRNRFAHEEHFSVGDAYRTADTVARTLRTIGSAHAEEAARLAREVLRLLPEEESSLGAQPRVGPSGPPATPVDQEPRPKVTPPRPEAGPIGVPLRGGSIDRAADLLRPGESAIVIFTDGREFKYARDGSGETGYWKIDPKRPFEKVIIYRRDQVSGTNEVWTAILVDVVPAPEGFSHRFIVRLSRVGLEGTTDKKWFDFAETGPNPIRYLTKS